MGDEMEKNELKKIFFIAVTDEPESNNRKYSDFICEMCRQEIQNDEELAKIVDFDSFGRHDKKAAVNIKKSLYEALDKSDIFIVLLDMYKSGYNPNVWFELGVISTSEKPIILIAKERVKIPFDINDIKVVRFPKSLISEAVVNKKGKQLGRIVDDILNKTNMASYVNSFSSEFIQTLKCSLNDGNPFSHWYEKSRIKNLGYNSLMDLFVNSGIIRLIQNPDVHAEYIAGEKNAFDELTIEVNNAVESIRTTRFGDQSIAIRNPDEYDEITIAHDNFMKALYAAESRVGKFDRIICNNNPYKWYDITQILKQPSKNVNVYIRKYNYNINFELVVIDERVAFIHFYQTNQSGDYDESLKIGENEARHDSQTQRIKSTLKITGKQTCIELAKIFDRLHHRDSNHVNPKNLSRTLLGVESPNKLTEIEKHAGYFTPSQRITPTNDPQELNTLSEENRKKFIDALSTWNIKGRDKMIMMIGLHLVYNTPLDIEKNLNIDDKKIFNEILEKYNIDTSVIKKFDLNNLSDNK